MDFRITDILDPPGSILVDVQGRLVFSATDHRIERLCGRLVQILYRNVSLHYLRISPLQSHEWTSDFLSDLGNFTECSLTLALIMVVFSASKPPSRDQIC